MRLLILAVTLAIPAFAAAQTPQTGTEAAGPPKQTVPQSTPAPVPQVQPPTPQTGTPTTVPEQIVPPAESSADPNAPPPWDNGAGHGTRQSR
jgi:hypothetical protein